MKKILELLYLLIVWGAFSPNFLKAFPFDSAEGRDKLVRELSSKNIRMVNAAGVQVIEVGKEEAEQIADQIIQIATELETILNGVIEGNLTPEEFSSNFFPGATIEISSVRKPTEIETIPVALYYFRLRTYTKRGGKIKISPYFIFNVEQKHQDLPTGLVLVKLEFLQHFMARDYRDITLKELNIVILFQNGQWIVGIEKIRVVQTFTEKDAKKLNLIKIIN